MGLKGHMGNVNLFSVLMLSSLFLLSSPIVLPEIGIPDQIRIYGDRCYIGVESGPIYIFSRKDYKLIGSFGKDGQGPGEFGQSKIINFGKGDIYVSSSGKVSHFSLDGQLLSEKKVPSRGKDSIKELGNGYVLKQWRLGFNQGKSEVTQTVCVLGSDCQKNKTLYETSVFADMRQINLVPANIDCLVDDQGNVYVAETDKGFIIEVFDLQGKPIRKIEAHDEKREIDENFKREKLEQQRLKNKEAYEIVKNMLVFPKYFPSIARLSIDGDRVWVKTYRRKGNTCEFVQFSTMGKELRRSYLPEAGALYAFQGDQYYYVLENEDESTWELQHISIIN
jgi:hypothetical protein